VINGDSLKKQEFRIKLLTISLKEFHTIIYSGEFPRRAYDTMLNQDRDFIKDW